MEATAPATGAKGDGAVVVVATTPANLPARANANANAGDGDAAADHMDGTGDPPPERMILLNFEADQGRGVILHDGALVWKRKGHLT
jgi:hypothetical protein